MKVPFMNLSDGIKDIYPEIMNKVKELIDTTQFIGGKEVSTFEQNFAKFCGTKYAVGCSNGTDAIKIALIASGIKRGDTVLVPANTFIATAEAVTSMGANVEFIDVDERTYTIDPEKIVAFMERKSIKNVRAIVPVHLYGQMADMQQIMEIAERYKLKVIEDSAQAHGALLHGKKPGTYSGMATFSFYPGKNLGAFGDAGAIIMNDFELYKQCKMYVDHGRFESKYEHFIEGFNNRLDTLQAAILNIKLGKLTKATEIRREKAKVYLRSLQNNNKIVLPFVAPGAEPVWHLFVVRIENRDKVQKKLSESGISTGVHYPIPLHLQPAYKYKNHKKGDFLISEEHAATILSLPLWPEITEEQIEFACKNLLDAVTC